MSFKTETINKIFLIVRETSMFSENEKQQILDEIRTEMNWLNPGWKEPNEKDNSYLRNYYNNMFK